MLSNSDFANFLNPGGNDNQSNNGKVRFDLKQISTWDKQNNAKRNKKAPIQNPLSATKSVESSDLLSHGKYRDRALERRQDIRTSDDLALEAVVSKLDAQQTKFLGGDVEHTHLVKGSYSIFKSLLYSN